jgi:hypothetical protein
MVSSIQLKEIPDGFRVLSVDAVDVDSLGVGDREIFNDNLSLNKAEGAEGVFYRVAMYTIDPMEKAPKSVLFFPYSVGTYCDMSNTRKSMTTIKDKAPYFISLLNKDIQ